MDDLEAVDKFTGTEVEGWKILVEDLKQDGISNFNSFKLSFQFSLNNGSNKGVFVQCVVHWPSSWGTFPALIILFSEELFFLKTFKEVLCEHDNEDSIRSYMKNLEAVVRVKGTYVKNLEALVGCERIEEMDEGSCCSLKQWHDKRGEGWKMLPVKDRTSNKMLVVILIKLIISVGLHNVFGSLAMLMPNSAFLLWMLFEVIGRRTKIKESGDEKFPFLNEYISICFNCFFSLKKYGVRMIVKMLFEVIGRRTKMKNLAAVGNNRESLSMIDKNLSCGLTDVIWLLGILDSVFVGQSFWNCGSESSWDLEASLLGYQTASFKAMVCDWGFLLLVIGARKRTEDVTFFGFAGCVNADVCFWPVFLEFGSFDLMAVLMRIPFYSGRIFLCVSGTRLDFSGKRDGNAMGSLTFIPLNSSFWNLEVIFGFIFNLRSLKDSECLWSLKDEERKGMLVAFKVGEILPEFCDISLGSCWFVFERIEEMEIAAKTLVFLSIVWSLIDNELAFEPSDITLLLMGILDIFLVGQSFWDLRSIFLGFEDMDEEFGSILKQWRAKEDCGTQYIFLGVKFVVCSRSEVVEMDGCGHLNFLGI
ncbi:hypothetical protein REPUB_Repub08aG0168900 [Reevesia pubescens]